MVYAAAACHVAVAGADGDRDVAAGHVAVAGADGDRDVAAATSADVCC